jgi:cytochrome c2
MKSRHPLLGILASVTYLLVSFTTPFTTPFTASMSLAADGVVAGWDTSNGQALLGELKCAACHAPGTASALLSNKEAPNLSKVGSRVTPQYLQAYLANPHSVKKGTPMPDMIQPLPKAQQAGVVDALTHYLVSLGEPLDQRESGASMGEIASGRELYHTIGCVACHQPFDGPPKHKIDPAAAARRENELEAGAIQETDAKHPHVPLPPLAMKTTVDALAEFLHNPLATRPSGRMPSLSLKPAESRGLAAYLLREQYTEDQTAPASGIGFVFYEGSFPKVADMLKATPKFETLMLDMDLGKALAKVPTANKKPPGTNFSVRFHGLIVIPADGEYKFFNRADDGCTVSIDGKVVVDNDGIHPPQNREGKVTLKKGRHSLEVLFSQQGGGYEMAVQWQPPGAPKLQPIPSGVLLNEAAAMIPKGIVDFKPDPAKIDQGRQLFATLQCASCHQTGDKFAPPTKTPPALLQANAGSQGSCLSEDVASGRPRYDLNKQQRGALRDALTALQQNKVPNTPADQVHLAMTTMNCYACHQRGKVGGPSMAKSNYFVYDKIVDLGDEGRLAPPLHEVGAKLTRKGFDDMLVRDQKYRTYMATRMPKFGPNNVQPLVAQFEKADAGKVPTHKPAFSPRMVDEGRFLLGKTALSCINCHTWGPHRLPGAEGMDLQVSTSRLQAGWFQSWLKHPQKMRPGTRMPTAWPQGKTFFKDVAGGDVDRQVDAIWAFLSVGNKGGFPKGLAPNGGNVLEPSDETIVFRTFLNQVSAHAIMVGFRQRTHMAFDANRIRSSLAWTGQFVETRHAWDGRAGQYAQIPSNDVIKLPEGPAFSELASQTTPWPKDKPKERIGSNRTPDGWRFRGYRLDKERNPTFIYDIQSIKVEETPSTAFQQDTALLKRAFSLQTADPISSFYFLAADGAKIVEQDGVYVVDDRVRFKFTGSLSGKPFIRESEGKQQLLLPIDFMEKNKQHVATFGVEMEW